MKRRIFDFYQSFMETELIVNSAVSTKRSNVAARSQFTVSGQVRGQTIDLKSGRTWKMFLRETREKINIKISHHSWKKEEEAMTLGSERLSAAQTVKNQTGYIWTDATSQQNAHILFMEVHSCQTNEPASSWNISEWCCSSKRTLAEDYVFLFLARLNVNTVWRTG